MRVAFPSSLERLFCCIVATICDFLAAMMEMPLRRYRKTRTLRLFVESRIYLFVTKFNLSLTVSSARLSYRFLGARL